MGEIRKEVSLSGDRGEAQAQGLFDSGSTESLVLRRIAERAATLLHRREPLHLLLGDGKTALAPEWLTIMDITVTVKGRDYTFPANRFVVVDELADPLIIGVDIMQKWKIRLDPVAEELIVNEDALRLRLV